MSFYKWLLTSALIATLALTAACSDDDDDAADTGGDSSATPSVCDQKEDVDAAVTDLTTIDVSAEGTNAMNASVANVQSELDELKSAVGADIEPEVDALDSALSDADEILSGISDDATLNEKIDDVQAALTGVATAAEDLITTLDGECS